MRLIDADEIKYQEGCFVDKQLNPIPIIHKVATIEMLRDWTPTVPAIPLERIKQLREEIEQLKLVGYATVDGKRQIAIRAVFDLLDNMIKEYEG